MTVRVTDRVVDRRPVKPGPEMPYELAIDGADEVRKASQTKRFAKLGDMPTGDGTEWLTQRCRLVRRLSRAQHLRAFADAYCYYGKVCEDPSLEPTVIAAAKRFGIIVNKRKSVLRIILEMHIEYGVNSDDREEIEHAQNNYSRDESAIKQLIERRVKPSETFNLGQQRGEGLNHWCRKKQKSPVNQTKTGDEYAGMYKLTLIYPDGDRFFLPLNRELGEKIESLIGELCKADVALFTAARQQASHR